MCVDVDGVAANDVGDDEVDGNDDSPAVPDDTPLHKLADAITPTNMPVMKPRLPQQRNGYDCGVYVSKYAEYLLEKKPTSTDADMTSTRPFKDFFNENEFSDDNMTYEREKIMKILDDVHDQWAQVRQRVEDRKKWEREERRRKRLEGGRQAPAHDAEGEPECDGNDGGDSGTSFAMGAARAALSEAAERVGGDDGTGGETEVDDDEDGGPADDHSLAGPPGRGAGAILIDDEHVSSEENVDMGGLPRPLPISLPGPRYRTKS